MTSKWPKRAEKLVGVLMVKNEAERIVRTTFQSIKDYCSELIIYDTGSTDETINVITKFCQDNDMKLHLKQGEFVNFCVSRNVMLEYADEIYPSNDTYLLLLDAHDELQEGEKLVEFIKGNKGPQEAFYLTQRWWSGSSLDSYYNVRMVRTHYSWRYRAPVHEYIMGPSLEVDKKSEGEVINRLEGIYLYQDRTLDDAKSFNRFKRDKQLLYEEYVKDPHEPRTLFYLAQTCSCLGLNDECYKFYLLRVKELGFYEEIYQSFCRLGDVSQTLGHDWEESMTWYMKAYQHSQRAEPLVKIAEYYQNHNLNREGKPEWHTAYMFSKMACDLIFPHNQILFVNKRDYTYKRHSLLGIIAYYVGRYKEGKEACLKAIEAENTELDRMNLKFYLEKELEFIQGTPLACPCLISATYGDQEVRIKDELDVKHDRNKIVQEMIDSIVEGRRREARPLAIPIIEAFRARNIFRPGQPAHQSQPATIVPQQPQPQPELKFGRKDKRAQLRAMVNAKKKEVKTTAKK